MLQWSSGLDIYGPGTLDNTGTINLNSGYVDMSNGVTLNNSGTIID